MIDWGELTWNNPYFIIIAIAAGGAVFWFLTRHEREPLPMDFERVCVRCKLRSTGKQAHDFRYCPFCAAKYPPLDAS